MTTTNELVTAEKAAALLEFYRQFKRVLSQDKAEDDASAALRTIIALHEALAAAEARADAAEARVAVLEPALKRAADQLSRVHDDAFTQCAGWALVRSDGKAFSCMEINRCNEVARKSCAALETGLVMTDTPITDAQVEAVARAICRETNAFYGEPPCWKMTDNWPEDACDEPGCMALARAACAAMARAVREVMGDSTPEPMT